ncbi:hypothetical protein AB0M02_00240 [Actinoplanes sp. NPDC051861]|uniref:hypothetical protein n=1 Tax=Actinoplanes sp. NPDC051861 TaxID=3155170 RepID=UPI00341B9797
MSRPLIVVIVIAALSVATAVVLILLGVAQSRQCEPAQPDVSVNTPPIHPPQLIPWPSDPESAETGSPAPSPQLAPQLPGRHRQDTVRTVPADWMPATGADRIRALEQTRMIPRPDLSPSRKEGGS